MKKSIPANTFSLSRKLPNRHIKSLLFLAAIVVLLPLATLAAQLVTNLTPKAYTPTGTYTCKEALQKFNYDRPCNLSREESKVAPKGTKSYSVISYTCIDGFKDRYEVKSCMPQDRLLTYANSICNQHSLIKTIAYLDACGATPSKPTRTDEKTVIQNPNKTYKQVKYTCADGFVSSYKSICQSEDQLLSYVMGACKTHSICPQPSVTPTKSLTPTPTIIVGRVKCNTTTQPYSCPVGTVCDLSSGYCMSSITATPTKNPTPTPPTPTANPTTTTNNAPIITTSSLPSGLINISYSSSVEAIDADKGDSLSMSFSDLPFGLSQGPCGVPATGGRINCYISGIPGKMGNYSVNAIVKDSHGNSVNKNFTIRIGGM